MVQNNLLETRIREIVLPVVLQNQLFLEEVRVLRAGKHTTLRITVDLEAGLGGVTADQLDTLTHQISDLLDEKDPINGEYLLEISTPGVSRKLNTARHYSRSIGHLVDFLLTDGTKFTARIEIVNESSVVVIPEKKVPKSDKVIYEAKRELNFKEITSARVIAELNKPINNREEGE